MTFAVDELRFFFLQTYMLTSLVSHIHCHGCHYFWIFADFKCVWNVKFMRFVSFQDRSLIEYTMTLNSFLCSHCCQIIFSTLLCLSIHIFIDRLTAFSLVCEEIFWKYSRFIDFCLFNKELSAWFGSFIDFLIKVIVL